VFNGILVRRYSNRRVIRHIPVRPLRQRHQHRRIILLGAPYCQVCGQCLRADRMITCNGCRLVYHVECLIPLMHVIPMVQWLCPVCIMLSSVFYRDFVMRQAL
jgi:hypothetical protein